MAFKDFFVGKKEEVIEHITNEGYEPFIVNQKSATDVINKIKSTDHNFKGEVEIKEAKFPVELGEEHPYNFCTTEGLYRKFGLVNGVVNKYVDFIVGPGFYVECEDERAKKIIEQFMQDVNMDTLLRAWAKEALVKGNGFIEIGGNKDEAPKGLKVLNATYMYGKRNAQGVIERYSQYTGGFKKFDKNKKIDFETYQIAHLPFDRIGDDFYGLGIIYPSLITINSFLNEDKDMHMLTNRKANSPYHIKLGGIVGGKYYKPSADVVNRYGQDLEWLHNKHEWVTDGLTDIKVIDFGNLGDKFSSVLEHDRNMLFAAFQVPAVLMGMANIPEGLAIAQMDAFERRIKSMQEEMEKVIENDIFKRVLNANGLDFHVEFQWGRQSNAEKMERLVKIKDFMNNPRISESLFILMERDVVELLGYNKDEYETLMDEEEKKREEERPQPIIPGQNENHPQPIPKKGKEEVPEEKPTKEPKKKIKQNYETKETCSHCQENIEGINDVNEWLGFSYKKYVKSINSFISKDSFENLAATNDIEESAGYFSQKQVTELKNVLTEGFKKEKNIREIAIDIKNKVAPKDLYEITDTNELGKMIKSGESRDMVIARTEITRTANAGAIEHYKEGGVEMVRFVASAGNRTCEECESHNGEMYKIGEEIEIPVHSFCRCTYIPAIFG